MIFAFIHWSPAPEIFPNTIIPIRWYGLFFVFAFYFSYILLVRIFKREGKDILLLDKLTMYMLLSTIIGARLGHCLFYEPAYYLSHPIEILYVWQGGLASHGAGIAIVFAIWLFARKSKEVTFWWVIDRIVIMVALAGFFIRMGNLMNSEIVGKQSESALAFHFERNIDDQQYPSFYVSLDDQDYKLINYEKSIQGKNFKLLKSNDLNFNIYNPDSWKQVQWDTFAYSLEFKDDYYIFKEKNNASHAAAYMLLYNGMPLKTTKFVLRLPTQLFEALSYLLIFFFLIWYYFRKSKRLKPGQLFGLFLTLLFMVRFLIEFIKEDQVGFEQAMKLNMGQWLSIPFVLAGVTILYFSGKKVLPETSSESADKD
ncbi:prolipoprotein diacylglyceryl transferase [Bacteroidota bacterium]